MVFSPQTIMYWSIVVSTITAFIHIAFSIAVLNDANNLKQVKSQEPIFVSPFFWSLAVLFGGVIVAGLYWVIHHSSLRKE